MRDESGAEFDFEAALFCLVARMTNLDLQEIGKLSRAGDASAPGTIAEVRCEVHCRMRDRMGDGVPASAVGALFAAADAALDALLGCR